MSGDSPVIWAISNVAVYKSMDVSNLNGEDGGFSALAMRDRGAKADKGAAEINKNTAMHRLNGCIICSIIASK